MARKANFTPTGARNVGPSMRVTPNGETFASAQRRQRGQVGSTGVFIPGEKVSPERSFPSRVLRDMASVEVLDKYADGAYVNPFELDLDRRGMADYISFFDEPLEYDPDETSYQADADAQAPAPMSVIPTSTVNPQRPRTTAAGFRLNSGSTDTGTLSVIFRDGTYYNYYDVPLSTWMAFKAAPSKGPFIKSTLDSYRRGYANASAVPQKQSIHKAARVGQKALAAQRTRLGKAPRAPRAVQVPRQTRSRRVS